MSIQCWMYPHVLSKHDLSFVWFAHVVPMKAVISFFAFLSFFFPTFAATVNIFVHLLSFLRATCPAHLHFDCFILTMMSLQSVFWWLNFQFCIKVRFSTFVVPSLFGLMEVCFPKYFVVDHETDPYVIVGRTYWLKRLLPNDIGIICCIGFPCVFQSSPIPI